MTGHPFFDSGLLRGCGLGAFRAVILDFRPRLGNRCKLFPSFGPGAAVILDFRPRLANRCKLFPSFGPGAAVILDFRG